MPTLNSNVHRQSLQQALTKDTARQPPPVTIASANRSTKTAAAPNATPAAIPDVPLRLTDDQLAAVLRAAEPLAIGDRGAFLQDVATALQGQELGDRTVYRVVTQVQRRYYDPPTLGPEPRWGR
jgi:hypothetical protein